LNMYRIATLPLALVLIYAATATIPQKPKGQESTPSKRLAEKTQNSNHLPFDQARNVAVIILYAPPQTVPIPIGSGVWIGKQGFVATCQHVVGHLPGPFKVGIAMDPFYTESEQANISISAPVETYDAELKASDEDKDVALLKVDKLPSPIPTGQLITFIGPGQPPQSINPRKPVNPSGAMIQSEPPQAGQALLLAGFPLGDNTLVLQTGTATGFLSRQMRANSRPASTLRLMLSLVSNPGNSGGPVLDQNGSVVGLLEGNLEAPVRDAKNHQVYAPIVKLDDQGNAIVDANHQPQFEVAPLNQNSGISLAVPAKFIADLARTNSINLE
jgi:S1-C subfamily serine protease